MFRCQTLAIALCLLLVAGPAYAAQWVNVADLSQPTLNNDPINTRQCDLRIRVKLPDLVTVTNDLTITASAANEYLATNPQDDYFNQNFHFPLSIKNVEELASVAFISNSAFGLLEDRYQSLGSVRDIKLTVAWGPDEPSASITYSYFHNSLQQTLTQFVPIIESHFEDNTVFLQERCIKRPVIRNP